jgi:hypothetical protein
MILVLLILNKIIPGHPTPVARHIKCRFILSMFHVSFLAGISKPGFQRIETMNNLANNTAEELS